MKPNYKYLNTSISNFALVISFLILSSTIWSQTGHLELIHNDLKTSLFAKNNNSSTATSLQLMNDINHSLNIGINSSAPFSGLGDEAFFSLTSGEDILFRTNDTTRVRIGSDGLSTNNGGHITFRSPNNDEAFGIRTEDDGGMYIMQNNNPLNNIMFLDDDAIKVGIGSVLPLTELEVRQSLTPSLNGAGNLVSDIAGLTIESVAGSTATMFVHTDNDLVFCFNGAYQALINDLTGAYVSVSDERLKTDIITMPSVLKKVLELRPTNYSFKKDKESAKQIGFIAQEVEKIFPEVVYLKDNIRGLAYDQFGVLAIKSIQEQQVIIKFQNDEINKLKAKVNNQNKNINKLNSKLDLLERKIDNLKPS